MPAFKGYAFGLVRGNQMNGWNDAVCGIERKL